MGKTGQVAKDGALRAVGEQRGGIAGHDGRGANALEGALHGGAALDSPLESLDGGGAQTDTATTSTASIAAAIITAIITTGIDAITNTASVVATAMSIAVR